MITGVQYQVINAPRPLHVTVIERWEMFWIMCMSLGKAPLWAGLNAQFNKDELPLQYG